MKNSFWGAMLALAVIGAAAPALAAPIDTFAGTALFSDTSPLANNPVYFTGGFANPLFSFSPTAVGQSYTNTLSISATDTALRNSTYTDNIAISLNFFLPNFTTTTIGGTGSLTDTFVLIGYYNNGALSWGSPSTISFADGSILTASMANFTVTGFDGLASGSGDLTLKLTKGPAAAQAAVPEPITMSMFGAGVIGAGVIRRRRKKARKA